jgi:hypothetical protein
MRYMLSFFVAKNYDVGLVLLPHEALFDDATVREVLARVVT